MSLLILCKKHPILEVIATQIKNNQLVIVVTFLTDKHRLIGIHHILKLKAHFKIESIHRDRQLKCKIFSQIDNQTRNKHLNNIKTTQMDILSIIIKKELIKG